MSLQVEQFNCPNCGSPLDVKNIGASKTIVCPSCGSQIDLTQPPYQVVGNVGSYREPILTQFRLGMQGTLRSVNYQFIGRVRYRDEDDVWDEWLLLSSQGAYRWISDSEDVGLVLWHPITPTTPVQPDQIAMGSTLHLAGASARVRSRGSAAISYLEGELTWRAHVGDQMQYAEAVAGDTLFSVEWTPEEIEFYQGERLTKEEVEEAFDVAPPAQAAGAGGGRKLPPRLASTLVIVGVIALILLCVIVSAATSGSASGSGGIFGGSGVRSSAPSSGGGSFGGGGGGK